MGDFYDRLMANVNALRDQLIAENIYLATERLESSTRQSGEVLKGLTVPEFCEPVTSQEFCPNLLDVVFKFHFRPLQLKIDASLRMGRGSRS